MYFGKHIETEYEIKEGKEKRKQLNDTKKAKAKYMNMKFTRNEFWNRKKKNKKKEGDLSID